MKNFTQSNVIVWQTVTFDFPNFSLRSQPQSVKEFSAQHVVFPAQHANIFSPHFQRTSNSLISCWQCLILNELLLARVGNEGVVKLHN
jgi:hypothetical protein